MRLSPHFDSEEFRCKCQRQECDAPTHPSPRLIDRLESLRLKVGPLTIVSGIRCDYWNRFVGGEPQSEHLTGEGCDIACDTPYRAYELMTHALLLFTRVGYGKRDRGGVCFHVGVATDHPQRVLWAY